VPTIAEETEFVMDMNAATLVRVGLPCALRSDNGLLDLSTPHEKEREPP
jgi:hypothetical protein